MKKTYITTMPDHVGAFLKASRAMAELGLNITRVSYNKAIDVHTLFIEAEGEEEDLEKATEKLKEIGYLLGEEQRGQVILLEFILVDVPGVVTDVVELIGRYNFNISYMSSQADGSGYQQYKMGLFVEDSQQFSKFLNAASEICPVRVIDYDRTEKILDNSIFYVSFATELAERMGLDSSSRADLVLNANLVMQLLDERNEPFHKTFDYIRSFGEALARYRGEAFCPRITEYDLAEDLHIILIEPPCGSNICVVRHAGKYLFVDTGYACYREEMLRLLRQLIPNFDICEKEALVTHADVDHCGLLDLFSAVYMSQKSLDSLLCEKNIGGFRESNPLHAPYIRICKTLTSYRSPDLSSAIVIGGDSNPVQQPLQPIGTWTFGDLLFELYEGQGGHLPGEIVLVDREHHLVFTGDILINIKELTTQQAEYNRYAPYLMTSVDTEPKLCADQRKALPAILGPGRWNIFGGHGPRKELSVE